MKKTIFLFALGIFSIARISAQVQTIVSATAEISSCFNNTGDTTVNLKCGYDYTWKHPSDPAKDIYCVTSGDYQRTLSNYRGCDSVVTLHLTIPGTDCAPEGVASGKAIFSVASGKQVYFSKSNLAYSASGTHTVKGGGSKSGVFSFSENQWDYGYAFGYGTSGKTYLPTATSSGDSYAKSNINGTEHDWGVYNAISGGGNLPEKWRTLTKDEWAYLFGESSERINKWGRGKIHNIYGIILLPDDWTMPGEFTFTAGINASNYPTDVQWEAMAEAGAVFLPAAGYKLDGATKYPNDAGGYWSSIYDPNTGDYAFYVYFNVGNSKFFNSTNISRVCQGNCVRLVQDKK